jgi:hypothetical protein
MTILRFLFSIFVIFSSLTQGIYSQDDSLPLEKTTFIDEIGPTTECDVYISDKNTQLAAKFENVKLAVMDDTVVYVLKEGYQRRSCNLSNIKKIVFKNHGFWAGAGYGFAASVAIWGILGLATYQGGGHPDVGRGFGFVIGLVLGIPTALITGVVTEFATTDDVYTFPGNNNAAKSKKMKYILRKHIKME